MPSFNQSQRDVAGLMSFGIQVSKASATVPQSTTQNIFTVAGGKVRVLMLIGEVTVEIGAGTTPDLSVSSDPTVGTSTIIATDAVIASDEVGTLYSVYGAPASALVVIGAGWAVGAAGSGFIVPPGVILITTTESTAGATKWDLWYLPIDAGATVVSA